MYRKGVQRRNEVKKSLGSGQEKERQQIKQ